MQHMQALVDEILRHTGAAGIFRAKARTQAMRVHEMAVAAQREMQETKPAPVGASSTEQASGKR